MRLSKYSYYLIHDILAAEKYQKLRFSRRCNGRTDRPTDRRTDGRTDPLIEMTHLKKRKEISHERADTEILKKADAILLKMQIVPRIQSDVMVQRVACIRLKTIAIEWKIVKKLIDQIVTVACNLNLNSM